jgi:predicted methyltransferase
LQTKMGVKVATKAEVKAAEASKAREASELLTEALAGSHRSEEARARDKYRHPKETLEFFGLRSDMALLEVEPGSDGWYTEILAPVLRDHGTYFATNFETTGPEKSPLTRAALAFQGKLDANPDVYNKVKVVTLTKDYNLGEANSVDMVVTFRNSHLWKQDKVEDRVYAEMFRVLKPGGVLGIEQHRACAGDNPSKTFAKGYLPQPYVIERIEKAGFVFEAESHLNANSFDTRDYPKGVWTLPPSLAMGDKDREKYEKIGESDRMTLRYRKPENSPTAPAEPEAEAPKDDKPAADAPKPDAPKPDAAKTEAPKADAAKPDAPKADAPKASPQPPASAPAPSGAAAPAGTASQPKIP